MGKPGWLSRLLLLNLLEPHQIGSLISGGSWVGARYRWGLVWSGFCLALMVTSGSCLSAFILSRLWLLELRDLGHRPGTQ